MRSTTLRAVGYQIGVELLVTNQRTNPPVNQFTERDPKPRVVGFPCLQPQLTEKPPARPASALMLAGRRILGRG